MSSSFSTLQESQKEVLEKDAQKLALNFLTSSLSLELKNGSFESEISFLLNIGDSVKPVFLNGQVDLLLEKNNKVVIVDFKTDKYQNPEEYAVQMFLYRKAAEEIYDKPAVSYLFYLREGKGLLVNSVFQTEELLEYYFNFHVKKKIVLYLI